MSERGGVAAVGAALPPASKAVDCRSCGACCSYSREWPRFTLETDAYIENIPEQFVNEPMSGMRCNGDRCSALIGEVGTSTSCAVYNTRPKVCRACEPGDDACRIARRYFEIEAGCSS